MLKKRVSTGWSCKTKGKEKRDIYKVYECNQDYTHIISKEDNVIESYVQFMWNLGHLLLD